jgi:hypothetical protein
MVQRPDRSVPTCRALSGRDPTTLQAFASAAAGQRSGAQALLRKQALTDDDPALRMIVAPMFGVDLQSADTRLGGTTLVVRIPMEFQRRGGRKRIVAPDGSEIAPSSEPQPDGTLVKALARAWRWQRVLENGECATLAELSATERISRSYICRVLRLTLLAPDIFERVMDGGPKAAGLARLLEPFPVEWKKQREQLLTR